MQLSLLPREITPDTVLAALQRRIGEANGMTAAALTFDITGRQSAADERRLRDVIVQLRLEGHAICSHPTVGYYMAATAADLTKACTYLVERALTSLRQVSAMKHVALPDLYGQLGLPMPANEDAQQGNPQ